MSTSERIKTKNRCKIIITIRTLILLLLLGSTVIARQSRVNLKKVQTKRIQGEAVKGSLYSSLFSEKNEDTVQVTSGWLVNASRVLTCDSGYTLRLPRLPKRAYIRSNYSLSKEGATTDTNRRIPYQYNCILGAFLGTSVAWLLFRFVRIIYIKVSRKLRGCRERSEEPSEDYDTQEVSHRGIDGEVKSLLLSTINPDLEDILVKKLDVRHKGQYGWKKVGSALGIDQLDLEYWETAYYCGMPTNSPTKHLLETLNTRRPDLTVADLIDKL